jgi:2-polyprenyl-3-methyl-5-hydroxy-6-metoxy-1,4-benzoquinol methylase
MAEPWNVNIHYDARLDACVPPSALSALDVGCGDGFLAARLARRMPQVTAIDVDAPVLARARARFPDAEVTWCHGDVLTCPLAPGSFDAVVSNAALHHFADAREALRRLGELVRPGGTLAVVGFARASRRDWPWTAMAFILRGIIVRVRGYWEHTAPTVWPPPDTFNQVRLAAQEVLPGARIRRLLLGRYLMTWHSPSP